MVLFALAVLQIVLANVDPDYTARAYLGGDGAMNSPGYGIMNSSMHYSSEPRVSFGLLPIGRVKVRLKFWLFNFLSKLDAVGASRLDLDGTRLFSFFIFLRFGSLFDENGFASSGSVFNLAKYPFSKFILIFGIMMASFAKSSFGFTITFSTLLLFFGSADFSFFLTADLDFLLLDLYLTF